MISILSGNSYGMLKHFCCQGIEDKETQDEYCENIKSQRLEDIQIKRSEKKYASFNKIINNESIRWHHKVIDESKCVTISSEKKYYDFGKNTVLYYEWNIQSKKPGNAIIKLLRKNENTIVEEQIIHVIVTD